MTAGYGVDPEELDGHAEAVRERVNAKVAAAHEAARYEPGLVEMGILGFVVTQVIDLKNRTDRLIMLADEFGNDLVDRVDHGARTYRDIEEGNIELLNEIDAMIARQEAEQNPRGPRGAGRTTQPTTRPDGEQTGNPADDPTNRPDNEPGDDPGHEPGHEPGESDPPPHLDRPGSFTADGVRIRTRPQDGTIAGLGYREHDVTVHTGHTLPGHPEWVRITDNTTGRCGWSHGDHVAWDEGPDRDHPDRDPGGR